MGLSGFVLAAEAILVQDGIELPLSLRSNIKVQILISVGDVFSEIDFAWTYQAFEHTVSVVHDKVASSVRLRDGKQEYVFDIRRHHHTSALADGPHRSDPDLFACFGADNRLGLVLVLWGIGVGDIGVEPMAEELLDDCIRAVVGVGSVPNISPPFRITLTGFVRARESSLMILINDLSILYNHTDSPEVNFVVIRHHVVQRVVFLIFDPLTLAGGLGHLIGRKAKGLGVGSTMDQIREIRQLI